LGQETGADEQGHGELTLRDIAAQLERMHERKPRGGRQWQVSSVKALLDRACRLGLVTPVPELGPSPGHNLSSSDHRDLETPSWRHDAKSPGSRPIPCQYSSDAEVTRTCRWPSTEMMAGVGSGSVCASAQ
jgi:hypothetical protein